MIRRHVLDRDGHRCRVPGCSSVGFLHIHHEPGRDAVGHDPAKMCPMCDEHHRQRHLGLLELREDPDVGFRFFRADGVELTGAPGEVAALAPDEGPPPVDAAGIDADARTALADLGFDEREAANVVAAAREELIARAEAVAIEELMQEALIM